MAEFNRNIRGIIDFENFETLPRRNVVEGWHCRRDPGKILPVSKQPRGGPSEAEGVEAVMPDLLDFLLYCFYNSNFKADNLGRQRSTAHLCNMGISLLEYFRRTCRRELERSTHFLFRQPDR